ncbi:MAG: alkaline phosphatase [Flavobacteriaceae bacterium]|jgi:alkaline phosphatase|tara:strand:- start:4229 stop:5275 length:1047 start_codon:yes stop_codon:yes gene_type:complete
MPQSITLLILLVLNSCIAQEKNPNIILMIGDGMGLTQISSGMYANDNSTALEDFEYIGLSKTHSYDQLITDSAASGTAMASGVKTYNGVVGINSKNLYVKSILEHSQEKGYKTALLATSSIVHATPASFYANVPSRRQYQDIALQLREHDVDLFIGGGSKHFNKRDDKRNLIEEMTNYHFVKSLNELSSSDSQKIGYLTYKDEPPTKNEGRSPALEDMASISIQKMESFGEPFFMMIEGSQIDWGGHANEMDYVLSEFKEFNITIQRVLDYAKSDGNTLVIVTADHETGGLTLSGGNIKRSIASGTFSTKGHSAEMVPVFSYGPKAELFKGVYENTEIFDKMLDVLTK